MAGLTWWLVRRKRQGKPTLTDPELFQSKPFRIGITQQMLQQIAKKVGVPISIASVGPDRMQTIPVTVDSPAADAGNAGAAK